MIDYGTLYRVARLERALSDLSSALAIYQVTLGASGNGSLLTLANLRAADNLSLIATTIFLLADDNGDSGLFYYDSSSSAADDGLTVIVDAAGRRWRRLSPIV